MLGADNIAFGETVEPIGPSSRRTGLAISEIMYHPPERADGKNLEFVELYNSEEVPADLTGHRLSGDFDFVFPTNTVLAGLGYLVVAPDRGALQQVYGLSGVLGPAVPGTNSLPNAAGTIRLRNPAGAVLLEVTYADDPPWPAAADGFGHSLSLARPSYGEQDPRAWSASSYQGGSPGTAEPPVTDLRRNVMINEFLAHTDDPELDYIELYNHSNVDVDISGCYLSDDPSTNKFTIPAVTRLSPGGYISFNQTTLGFSLSAAGETIYLKNPEKTRVLDAVRFGPQENGVSSGRFPNGGSGFYRLAEKSPGTPNLRIRSDDIVINEIMYHPPSQKQDEEYVELYNRSAASVSIGGWKFVSGIRFTFPTNQVIPSGGFLVVARNTNILFTNYSNLNPGNTVGNFSGSLSDGGERLALTKPDTLVTTNTLNIVETNHIDIVVADVDYQNGGRWGKWSDGGGSSLELIDPFADGRLAANWADSDETRKAPWTAIEATGVLDNGSGTPDSLQMFLQDAGECLVDNVEVIGPGGNNLISNPTFEGSATGWIAEGSQGQSSWEASEGFSSANSIHVRSVVRGDTGANRIRTTLTSSLAAGQTATIRAKARWLRGHPELLLRLRGNYLEAIGRLALPKNPGTPGAPNSRKAPTGPAIYAVEHSPVLPAANQAVIVTARVHDPDGIAGVTLNYRVDPAGAYSTVSMTDSGLGGDTIAGDGVFSAAIAGQPAGALVAFYIQATDNAPTIRNSRSFPDDAPARECLVRFGETQPTGSFGTYRFWMTQATASRWASRSKLDNTPLDITFVYGNQRVIYNTAALFAGSPYISPGYNTPSGNLCGYTGSFPADDRFLGASTFVLDWPGRDNTAIEEQLSFWIADRMGLPNSYRRFIHLHVNGVVENQRGSVYEDVQQPGGDLVKEWVPDDADGRLFKIERWFEFSDAIGLLSDAQPRLQNYTTAGGLKKLARYRWNWLPRAVEDSVNDYTNIFALVDAVNAPSPEPYTSQTEGLVDIEEWMGIFAVERIINNFDSYGHEIGKNMYAYKPENGKWITFMFDNDWLMKESAAHNSYNPSSPLFTPVEDPTIARMYNHPPFRRAYFRAIRKAVDGPLVASRIEPLMDAKYNALVANGVTRSAGQVLAGPAAVKSWISQRRAYLVQQLDALASAFAITSNAGMDFSVNTNLITLTGTAPIEVTSLRVNGVNYLVSWIGVTNWSIRVALTSGNNGFVVEAFDQGGSRIANGTDSIIVNFTGTNELPEGNVIIDEIMYNPIAPNAEFIEIYNRSATTAFDLSSYRLKGVDFDFPAGTILGPGGYLVLAADRAVFAATYGTTISLAGEFTGRLDKGGETLSLVRLDAAGNETVVDSVTYEDDLPWPAAADGGGASLQLIDPAQNNGRVANWAALSVNTNNNSPPQWQYVSTTGTASSSLLYVYLQSAGDVYLDDLKLVAGNAPEVGANQINNGDFEMPLSGPWTISPNHANSVISTTVKHSGTASLHLVASSGGTTQASSVWQGVGPLVTNTTYTLSYWYLPSTNGSGLTIRLSGNGINSSHGIQPGQQNSSLYTPGAGNSVKATLPVFPDLWLNEIQPNNVSGLADRVGDRDPWVELYNSGSSVISLAGFYLTDVFTNLAKWAFPATASIQPGQHAVVWLDGEPGESTATEWHTSFRASSTNGVLALVWPLSGSPAVLDYLIYDTVLGDRSIGYFPDGSGGKRQTFFFATPGRTNDFSPAPAALWINEWMASNTNAVVDPADGHHDDWFELFNAGNVAVDLTGYSVATNLTTVSARWSFPAGTVIPANGYLLVWADDDLNQNSTNSPDRHAPFKLPKTGAVLGLFAPNGALLDSVTFGAQVSDVSEGRTPDGASTISALSIPSPGSANVSTIFSLRITQITYGAGGEITLGWTAQPAKTYRVQFKNDLNDSSWNDLPGTPSINGNIATQTDFSATSATQRFYRVVQTD